MTRLQPALLRSNPISGGLQIEQTHCTLNAPTIVVLLDLTRSAAACQSMLTISDNFGGPRLAADSFCCLTGVLGNEIHRFFVCRVPPEYVRTCSDTRTGLRPQTQPENQPSQASKEKFNDFCVCFFHVDSRITPFHRTRIERSDMVTRRSSRVAAGGRARA